MDFIVDESHVETLEGMGFPDPHEIRRALRIAKNDMNEAVALLTNEMPGLEDVEMVDVAGPVNAPTTSSYGGEGSDSLEFPTTNLYELEGRVFVSNWSIPYRKDESLGKCLIAAARFARDGLLKTDENCVRFLDRCMPECFDKLLTSNQVQKWAQETQEGIYQMLNLLVDLACACLESDCVYQSVFATLAKWEDDFGVDRTFAAPPVSNTYSTQYGYLCNLLNKFASKKGFDAVAEKVQSGKHNAQGMFNLIRPLAQSAAFLNADVVAAVLEPCLQRIADYVAVYPASELHSSNSNSVVDLLCCCKVLSAELGFVTAKVEIFDKLRLDFTLRLLKSSQFSSRMQALKEVTKILESLAAAATRASGAHPDKSVIPSWQITEWLAENQVLSLALEGNLDQPQYCERLKSLLDFLGPRMTVQEIQKIWQIRRNRTAGIVDNVYLIIAQAASKFGEKELTHLLSLVEKSWSSESPKGREKLLMLVGRIGKESTVPFAYTRAAELLWVLAHHQGLSADLVNRALAEQLETISQPDREHERNMYIQKCVEDIQQNTFVLPAISQLHLIIQNAGKGIAVYGPKPQKKMINELVANNDLVRLLCTCLVKAHSTALELIRAQQSVAQDVVMRTPKATVTVGASTPKQIFLIPASPVRGTGTGSAQDDATLSPRSDVSVGEETLVLEDGYTFADHVTNILAFLRFILVDGDLFIGWVRVKELFDALVDNPDALDFSRRSLLEWLTVGIVDLEPDTKKSLFEQKILKLDPVYLPKEGFACFRQYFEEINKTQQKMTTSFLAGEFVVEKLDLTGIDFVWRVALCSANTELVNQAIELLISTQYSRVTQKLKKDGEKLHRKFLDECRKRLEAALLTAENSFVGSALSGAAQLLIGCVAPGMVPGEREMHDRNMRVLNIERLLLIAEKYIRVVEDQSLCTNGLGSTVPTRQYPHLAHAVTFFGQTLKVKITVQKALGERQDFDFLVHGNEQLGSLRARLAKKLNVDVDRVTLETGEKELKPAQDSARLCDCLFDDAEGDTMYLTSRLRLASGMYAGYTSSSSTTTTMAVDREKDNSKSWSMSRSSESADAEKHFPSLLLARDPQVFEFLYQIHALNIPSVSARVRELQLLLPTDPTIAEALDSLAVNFAGNLSRTSSSSSGGGSGSKSNSLERLKTRIRPKSGAAATAIVPPQSGSTGPDDVLKSLFTFQGATMSPLRLHYNLEVLSAKLLPTAFLDTVALTQAQSFCHAFLAFGGLNYVIAILDKNFLPSITDLGARRAIYGQCLHVLKYLLCGASALNDMLSRDFGGVDDLLEGSASANVPLMIPPTSKAVKDLCDTDFPTLLDKLQRLAWAAAGGSISTLHSDFLSKQSSSHVFAFSARTRASESSTGSDNEQPSCLHSAVAQVGVEISPADAQIAEECINLIIECVLSRDDGPLHFFRLPHVQEFILDLLLMTASRPVRQSMRNELLRLCSTKSRASAAQLTAPPNLTVLKILLQFPLPLWPSSGTVRSTNQKLLSQCSEYFNIRADIIEELPAADLSRLQPSPVQMLEDECNWLLNYTCASIPQLSQIDNVCLEAHLRLLRSLLKVQSNAKKKVGRLLCGPLVYEFLFPASRCLVESTRTEGAWKQVKAANMRAKCQNLESRSAAFNLLLELCNGCTENFAQLTALLLKLHHHYSPELAKEWDYQPLVDPKHESGFVGLKNAGATCYMNSVLQQFLCQPFLPQQLLSLDIETEDKDGLLYQLQRVFGHLLESELQYFTPRGFWETFRLYGQPVNPREQQDAFEFFTDLINQIDDQLHNAGFERLFKPLYQGIFSDQKICKECPHRFEREEEFFALNLAVRTQTLEDSLNQFVKGEVLEGDNAYYCEKCDQKRTALKRMCVKTLPPMLVFHLKRFDYDHEEKRALKFNDYFQFPLSLDMYPYTQAGIDELCAEVDWTGASPNPRRVSSVSEITSPLQKKSVSDGAAALFKSRASDAPKRLYNLVGVVVHSGQAYAGHYYSFLKDRRQDVNTNRTHGKWFKFNDTTVEMVDFSDQLMETELYGGKYTVKAEKNSLFPEERERYWNAYILVYQMVGARDSGRSHRITPKRSLSIGLHMAQNKNPRRRDSLLELKELVEEGERNQLFSGNSVPTRIKQEVQESNLWFARNRDVCCYEYAHFIRSLVGDVIRSRSHEMPDDLATAVIELTVHYLLHTEWHLKRSLRYDTHEWTHNVLDLLMSTSGRICSWMVSFFAGPGIQYLAPYLFECTMLDVRQAFAYVIGQTLMRCEQPDSVEFDTLLRKLIGFSRTNALESWQCSQAYFQMLERYVSNGWRQCVEVLKRDGFDYLMGFLLDYGSEASGGGMGTVSLTRRWSLSQCREFGPVYNILAVLVLHCDLTRHYTLHSQDLYMPRVVAQPENRLSMPDHVELVLYGNLSTAFMKEILWASTHVHGTCAHLTDLVLYCCFNNQAFSMQFLREALQTCASQPSNELKQLFALLEDLIMLQDAYAAQRVEVVLDGLPKDAKVAEMAPGLLAIIEASQDTDSRRAYNCIKFLMHVTGACPAAMKDALNARLERWQWAVDWLRRKMEDYSVGGKSAGWIGGGASGLGPSNEDSSGKTFMRTHSAQHTLDQATALLTEFGGEEATSMVSDAPTSPATHSDTESADTSAAMDRTMDDID